MTDPVDPTRPNGAVLIHGAWHDHHTWDAVVPLLERDGRIARAIDLPGAGANAPRPESFDVRPLDPAAFGTEPSPNAGVSQDERTEVAIDAVRALNSQTNGKAVVVGHSLGGLTVSTVVEAIPDEVSAAVYLTAFMLPPGMPAVHMIEHELMADALVPSLFLADPQQVGALRIDPASPDEDYRNRVRAAFYADLDDQQFESALRYLHPDEPAQVAMAPSSVTRERFGAVARHYIQCTHDHAIPHSGQEEMVRLMDAAMGNATTVHRLDTSHSPFHSQPVAIAKLIGDIAAA